MANDNIIINSTLVPLEDVEAFFRMACKACGYNPTIRTIKPLTCYAINKKLVLEWDSDEEEIIVKHMKNTNVERYSVIDYAKRCYEYTKTDCVRDIPECQQEIEHFISNPEKPITFDATEYQEMVSTLGTPLRVDNDGAHSEHALSMMSSGLGDLNYIFQKSLEKDREHGILYDDLLDALSLILEAISEFCTANCINLTELMWYDIHCLTRSQNEREKKLSEQSQE
ncbi:MAG: hypothetical protein NC131_10950 [Roseburia sp.]|nr:hypothetical protein [Roseburia sp.]